MAVTLGTDARNASVSGRTALVNSGTLRLRQSTTTICDIALGATAFGAPSTGSATANGLPLNGTAVANATTGIDNYQVLDSSANVEWSGTASLSGGGGDLILAAVIVGTGTTVSVTSWTHAQPAS